MGLQVIYIKSKWVTKVISRVIVFHVMVKEITNYLITKTIEKMFFVMLNHGGMIMMWFLWS